MTDDGERVENCDNCGICCMGQNLLPLSGNLADDRRLPRDLNLELLAIRRGPLKGDDDCPCVWLDRSTGRCRHYKWRPSTCRALECGGEDCMAMRHLSGVETQ
ncbi:unnamed protein product [marine sediment metagenome]|uniref:Zinc/iron-chelating domain-containing protein n=1 Tax=marine sediment metagenome TaxID=412755 RepID=X0VP00_9ZZZZ